MKVLIYHPSRQHIYKIVEGLEKARVPYIFYTGLYHMCGKNALFKLLSSSTRKYRYSPSISSGSVRCIMPWIELIYIAWAKTGLFLQLRNRALFPKQYMFQKNLFNNLNFHSLTHVITFHTNAFYLFKKIKEHGFKTQLLLESPQPHPEWIMKLYTKYSAYREFFPLKYTNKMIKQYSLEFKLADTIIVPSTFVKKTLIEHGVSEDKIHLLFHGSNFYIAEKNIVHSTSKLHPELKVAYTGLISFSKGTQFLFEVARQTASIAEFHLFGHTVNKKILQNVPDNVYYHGFVDHSTLMTYYKSMDIFYFPTLYDASGLALLEAVASGLIPIASPYSIAPDIILDKETGFLAEPENTDYVVELLKRLYSDRDYLNHIKENIQKKYKAPSWRKYQEGYINLLK